MTKKRIIPSVRAVVRRLRHILTHEPVCVDYYGTPVVTLYVRQGYYRGTRHVVPSGWNIYSDKEPSRHERSFRTAYATESVDGRSLEAIARDLLRSVRDDAECRGVWRPD